MDVNEFSKKVSTYSMMCIVVVSFMMGCFSFNKLFLSKEPDHKWISTTISWTKTGERLTWVISTGVTKSIVLNTEWTKSNNVTNWESKKTNTGWTKSILGVYAWYDGESEYERVRNQIMKLWVSYEIAEHITREGYTNTDNPKQFIKNIVGVSQAESSIFKHCSKNNCFGVMMRLSDWSYTLRSYTTIQESISAWRELYVRNNWWARLTWQDWLNGNYCTSACSYRIQNYNDAINKLNI